MGDQPTPAELETHIAHPARMYDYYLGGKDNYAADREAAEKSLAIAPELRLLARENGIYWRLSASEASEETTLVPAR